MLVISRKVDETITIGDDIKLTVVSIKGNQVKIGIEAPVELKVWRDIWRDGYDANRNNKELKS
jgi:carbon storage regulator